MSEERIDLQGRRIQEPACYDELKAGDYFTDKDGRWFVCVPNVDPHFPCPITKRPNSWTVVEHEDETISVTPSLHMVGYWHGYLTRGFFKSC